MKHNKTMVMLSLLVAILKTSMQTLVYVAYDRGSDVSEVIEYGELACDNAVDFAKEFNSKGK